MIFLIYPLHASRRGLFRPGISFAFLSIRALCRFTGDTRQELERVSEKVFYFGVRAGRGFNWQGQIGLEGTQINQISDVCKFAQKSYFQVAPASGGYT
jgi:hypothetical protein